MKTIIRLITLAMLLTWSVMVKAQLDITTLKNPEWFKKYIGKSVEEMEKMGFPCDSLKWNWPESTTWYTSYSRYVEHTGEYAGKYEFNFEKDQELPVCKAKCTGIIYVLPEPIPVYRIDKVEWYAHLNGKTISDPEADISCDSIRLIHTDPYGEYPYRLFVVNRGDHLGKYVQHFKKEPGVAEKDAVLFKTSYVDALDIFDKQKLAGVTVDREYILRQMGVHKELTPSEKVWLKFWEVHLKNEAKKSE